MYYRLIYRQKEKENQEHTDHSSTLPSSCKVTDLTPARTRFFAAGMRRQLGIK
uniref:Uncharacterized protein n=1 Tax=Arundo donax TaxID=35708 RepID=A0A0A8Z1D5_ARUDO